MIKFERNGSEIAKKWMTIFEETVWLTLYLVFDFRCMIYIKCSIEKTKEDKCPLLSWCGLGDRV